MDNCSSHAHDTSGLMANSHRWVELSCVVGVDWLLRITDKRPPSWFFTMRKLTCETIESNFHDFYATVLSHAVSEFFACNVKHATREQHLLTTRFTEYRKNQPNGLNKLQQRKMSIYLIVRSVATWVIIPEGCALYLEEKFYWKTSLVAFCPYGVHRLLRWSSKTKMLCEWLGSGPGWRCRGRGLCRGSRLADRQTSRWRSPSSARTVVRRSVWTSHEGLTATRPADPHRTLWQTQWLSLLPSFPKNEMRVYSLDLEIRRNIVSLLYALKDLRSRLSYIKLRSFPMDIPVRFLWRF